MKLTKQHAAIMNAAMAHDAASLEHLLERKGYKIDVRNKDGETPLMTASKLGFVPAALLLIAHGSNVNAVDGAGFTPLHYAARGGYEPSVSLLVRRGGDINAVDSFGLKPSAYLSKDCTLDLNRMVYEYRSMFGS